MAVFNHFLGHLFTGGRIKLEQVIFNPFISQKKRKTRSFKFFRARDGTLLYHDSVTGETGNCVCFVSKLKNINRVEAIRLILILKQEKE